MMRFCQITSVVLLAGLLTSLVPAQMLQEDEQTLKNNKIPTDTDGLISFFEKRSLKEGQAKILEDLVRKLGSDVYRVREPAYKDLVAYGPMALPFLKSALTNSPLEMKRRAENCIVEIEKTMQLDAISSAARVLAARKPERAAEILFSFLPSVNDPFLEEEILATVGKLTVQPGKVDPLIINALKDPLAHRRAVAVYLLGRRGGVEHRDPLRALLADPDPLVARRVAEGLIGKRSREILQDALASDEKLLGTQNIELTDAGVFNFFRKRTLSEQDQERLRGLVRDLGKGVYATRISATKQLMSEGSVALPFLKQAEFDPNVELSRRTRFLLDEIRRATNTAVPIAAAHWLARPATKRDASPAEAIRVLLAYAPFADDETVEEEVLTCLTLLSLRESKLDTELVKALKDPMAIRRAAAAYVIGQVGATADVAQAKALLEDSHPVARLRAAQGMLAARDKSALPCLVQLVHEVPAPYLSRVEDPLYRLAEEKGPTEPIIATSIESRQKASKAWEKWLNLNQAKIDLNNLNDRESYLGLITIAEYDSPIGNINGQVFETNRSNQKRWNFGGAGANPVVGAMDAHTLSNGRVLVAENSGMRVTERDAKGTILWSHQVLANPIACQRLPNGNTFIACYNMLLEVRPDRTEVYRYTPGPQFFHAHKARNGNIVAITQQGIILELDSKTGQQLFSVQVQTQGNWCSVEAQPNGNYLVASMFPAPGAVREFDRKGTEVWSKPFSSAFRATKLPNGNVLVAGMNSRQVAEMDRAGNIRWTTTTAGRPWSVHYR